MDVGWTSTWVKIINEWFAATIYCKYNPIQNAINPAKYHIVESYSITISYFKIMLINVTYAHKSFGQTKFENENGF